MVKKRILILTADAGFGHRSAAKALAAALEEGRPGECEYEIANPLDHEKTPAWLHAAQSDYDRIAREAADLYKLSYDVSDRLVVSRMIENAMRVLLYRAMRDIVHRYRPDAIISTYPLYQAPLGAYFALSRCYVPLVCVVTDLATVHHIWFSGDADLTIVPTEIVRDLALGAGLAPERVELIGIPVHPRFSALHDAASAGKAGFKAALGLLPNRPTVLAVGIQAGEQARRRATLAQPFGSAAPGDSGSGGRRCALREPGL